MFCVVFCVFAFCVLCCVLHCVLRFILGWGLVVHRFKFEFEFLNFKCLRSTLRLDLDMLKKKDTMHVENRNLRF